MFRKPMKWVVISAFVVFHIFTKSNGGVVRRFFYHSLNNMKGAYSAFKYEHAQYLDALVPSVGSQLS